ncbi:MAG TPA: DUF3883 domain-containing protein [Pyrinomonadaceae bacterium]|nr:DUF3883 domain-containing protein [Pyrinomonadaceae bacterium]
MADYLVYWKVFWDEHPNGLIGQPDFLWHTNHQYWNNVVPGDTLWAIASGGEQAPTEWRLVKRLVVQEKYIRSDFDRSKGFRGDPTQSETFIVQGQSDLTPLLHQLQFRGGRQITATGPKIGIALRSGRPLTDEDSSLLELYAHDLVHVEDGDDAILDRLAGVSKDDFKPRKTSNGAGFGDPETNRRVEKAAIKVVTEWYVDEGWTVKSVEAEKCGYDLLCKRTLQEKHVEVKGVQGDVVAFIITAGEVRQAESDVDFVLCVITAALTPSPRLHFYDSSEFATELDLMPLAYRATLRRDL